MVKKKSLDVGYIVKWSIKRYKVFELLNAKIFKTLDKNALMIEFVIYNMLTNLLFRVAPSCLLYYYQCQFGKKKNQSLFFKVQLI